MSGRARQRTTSFEKVAHRVEDVGAPRAKLDDATIVGLDLAAR
jgi:hypothetical protein